MNQVFKSLCGPLRARSAQISVGIVPLAGYVVLVLDIPEALVDQVRAILYAQYQQCQIEPLPDAPFAPPPRQQGFSLHLRCEPDLFPLKRYGQEGDKENRKAVDHLAVVREMIAEAAALPVMLQLTLRPAKEVAWRRRGIQCLRVRESPFFQKHERLQGLYTALAMSPRRHLRWLGSILGLADREGFSSRQQEHADTSAREEHQGEHEIQGASEKIKDRNLYEVTMTLTTHAEPGQREQARARLLDVAGVMSVFAEREARLKPVRPWQRRTFLLSTRELATLWHPPTAESQTAGTLSSHVKELEPPIDLPLLSSAQDITPVGEIIYRDRDQRFGFLQEDRRLHTAIIGKSGMGKTNFLKLLILSDIFADRGVIVLDPHGDLSDEVLTAIPERRQDDLVLFDVNASAPLSYNLFDCPDEHRAHRIISDMKTIFARLFKDGWGPQSALLFGYAARVLMSVPGSSLLDVQRFLNTPGYRRQILLKAPQSEASEYWLESFERKSPKFQQEMISPLQNKLVQFTDSPQLRRIIGQPKNDIDVRSFMDQGKILLCKISKGLLGEAEASLLGSFLSTDVQISTLTRADTPEHLRRNCYLYIDELQNYATDSFATILSEARKYRLIIGGVAFQFIHQLEETTRQALFGNVQNLVSFQVGVEDADLLAKQLGRRIASEDLLTLPKYHIYLRMMLHGQPCAPFLARTFEVPRPNLVEDGSVANALRHTIQSFPRWLN